MTDNDIVHGNTARGLSTAEAAQRLQQQGANEVVEEAFHPLAVFWSPVLG
ncbi:cation-transporting P-type ATPase [Gallionella capsiferriformans]|uniref:Cation transporting ATPase domain protein n=1 Tax=Gallionella capsiferriformans (strain ES-2) TaxID=395494 RepID=D9SEH7_GALCS|nr:cation transporting ATPase domain protein [Gallionella capsiferriformans ES-2]